MPDYPTIFIVGAGLADGDSLTCEAHEALDAADLVIGARRLLGLIPATSRAQSFAAILPGDIALIIAEHPRAHRVCVLMSGDTGFYSGTTKLVGVLRDHGYEVRILPGISSIQALSARLERPWQDWKLVSAHGRSCNPEPYVRDNRETFFLAGGELPAATLCRRLEVAGFGELEACVGENLGAPDERVFSGTVAQAAGEDFCDLAVLLVTNPCPCTRVSLGLADESFTRGKAPMTKSEVRAVILSKLQLCRDSVVWDVGAGTGSVTVEAALAAREGEVWGIEMDGAACELIELNAQSHAATNLHVVHGLAPEALRNLPSPDAVFIGGSKGNLRAIIKAALAANPRARIVTSAVTLETIAEATAAFTQLPLTEVDAVTVGVSRARKLGGYHLLTAQNPILILAATGNADEDE